MVTRTAYILISILTVPAFLTSSTFSFGQSGRTYNYGHIRYAEGEVTLQRALELEAAEAAINVPVMPGDRMWTATYGRAEVLFADGSVLQMDERTKVDFTAFGETAGAETLLRLWNGSLMLRIIDASAASYRIDTPAGSIFPVSEGLFRIDVDETGIATVSVYEGVAELASETGSVLVRTGQRSFVQQGLRPESPFEFNTALYDAFASWSDGREQLHRHARRIEGVPNEVAVYAGELQHYGNWRHDASYGQVWYPTVSIGWSPYTHGRWSYTSFGWTWISSEPWGWAPYHYGRWGHGTLGWHWIPGAYWGPAWVSWAFGPTWVGWSPLGYHNRPIVPYRSVFDYRRGGRAVPRYGSGHRGHGWSFAKNDHFWAGGPGRGVPVERTRLCVEDVRATANQGRLFESGAILDRELRPRAVGTAAMTRMTRTPAPNRTGAASSAASSRGGLRRGPRGTTPTTLSGGRTSTSRGYAVPRFAPTGTRGNGSHTAVSSAGQATGQAIKQAPGRATTGASNRGGAASTLGRVSAGVHRGDTANSANTANTGRPGAGVSRGRAPSSVLSPSRAISSRGGASRGTATTRTPSRPSQEVTRGPSVERSKGSSAGSKDFFGRRPSSVGSSRSEASGARATPRTPRVGSPSNNRSSQTKSSNRSSSKSGSKSGNRSGNRSGNQNKNRNSSRPRN